MKRLSSRLVPIAAAAVPLFAAACSTSPWERSFEPSTQASIAPAPSDAPVRIREVPWDRIQATLRELEAEVAASDVPPEEWPPERRAEADARLLRALQVTRDPATVEILGVSEFRTTDPIRPGGADQDQLARFARQIGATEVVWSRRYLGKTERIVDRPVTYYDFGSGWALGRYRRGAGVFTGSTTTWLPVVVEADESAYLAFFLR